MGWDDKKEEKKGKLRQRKEEKRALPKTLYKISLLQREPQSFLKQNGNKNYRPKLQQLLKAFYFNVTDTLNTHTHTHTH